MKLLIWLCLVVTAAIPPLLAAPTTAGLQCNYESCNLGNDGHLNVHLVPHTHNDVGWLKTVDQYFYGANNSIQHAGVQYILDSVVSELLKDPQKRFIYVETAFFARWWQQVHDSQRHSIKQLVNQGRLEFIGGGWSMNDEADAHYSAIIDQMTYGLRYLKTVFGECGVPRVAWQIDPFGHSREQASIFARMGYDGLFFGRMDYDDFKKRKEDKTLEHVWKGSANLGEAAYLFTGALYNGYNPPPGFCFDQFCDDPPIMDDNRMNDYNVEERVDAFIDYAKKQVCKQLDTLARLGPLDNDDVTVLKDALGVAQHHDAVTGTAKQHVTNDYVQRLSVAMSECQDAVNDANTIVTSTSRSVNTEATRQFTVTVYNPLPRSIPHHVRIPVKSNSYAVIGPTGEKVESQTVSVSTETQAIPERHSGALFELVFPVQLPPLGFQTFFVQHQSGIWRYLFPATTISEDEQTAADIIIKNEHVSLTFSGQTNLLTSMTNLDSRLTQSVQQSFYWYEGSRWDNATKQASGAYIFRPNGTTPIHLGDSVNVTLIRGRLVQEVRQQFTPWLSQVVRLYKGHKWAEFEWTVGPIPVGDNIGKEIVTRFDTKIQSNGVFYTDSNGREMLQRTRDQRPTWTLNKTEPVAGNYYPITSKIFIKDESNVAQFTVLNDRAQGGGSIADGSIEILVHRRLLEDDHWGVGEPLNETGSDGLGLVARGKHYVILESGERSAHAYRELALRTQMAPWMSFTASDMSQQTWAQNYKTNWTGLTEALPANVHILTLEQWRGMSVLLRLEHIYEKGEDAQLSQPVTVSLQSMFSPFEVVSAEEHTLAGNKVLSASTRLQWKLADESNRTPRDWTMQALPANVLDVTLKPMEIRTFVLTLSDANEITETHVYPW
ncbi:PREDICTED: lysosomal alpha-mannosidase-like [Priapulus caudatus]|uniref:Alpha-mannosidase n=1 Tax=Priapulus caudatus TaxID=37621 RepID=A0ABM1EL82_PRICU|nr:PREDICTED: lysosomal alpha-mannosidase-like [Priapulus caudatus]